MSPDDRQMFFHWATQSDATDFWYGEQFGEPLPNREQFFNDFKDYYFTGEDVLRGRSWAICLKEGEKPIGQINYQRDEEQKERVEYDVDILIAEAAYHGQGLGTEAMRLLTTYMDLELQIPRIVIYVHPSNPRAKRSYEKAGFSFEEEYRDSNGILWNKGIYQTTNK
jgi:RimJ/RimL family protein N-acetyltransferase